MKDQEWNELLRGVWDSLTDEQKEKAKACQSADEWMAFAGREGIELPDEALDTIAGGYSFFRGDPELYSKRQMDTRK